jgi:hypothetical protein
MARRRLGRSGVRALAGCDGFAAAAQMLANSPYRRPDPPLNDLAGAQHAVLETLLWNLRVLAGWLPADGVRSLRLLAAWFEIANVDEHLARLGGGTGETAFRLGVLGSAWPRLAATSSAAQLRAELAASVWGDPGGDGDRDIGLWLRVAWAQRVVRGVEQARPWALGATALLVAGRVSATGRPLSDRVARGVDRLLGPHWSGAANLPDLRDRLPARARWALDGVERPDQLWLAEAAWWRRLRADGWRLLSGGFGPDRPVGAAALLAVDAWQVRAALGLAARGPTRSEDLDVLA